MLKNGGNINHSDQGIASLCSAFPKGGGLKGKKPYAAHKFFCFSSLSLESFSPPPWDCLAMLGVPRVGGLKRKKALCCA